ncbi:BTB/POZ domain-containing protein 7-like isoform X1 [Anguilla rostrata]|uniref:BTB/POZ domain-containing protein 7-like isoform X1 n=1 Tax=Anguilla rostrata TaxID=7938 RepID=UPI0030CF6D80
MGVSASGYPNSCSPRFGGSSQSQHTLIGTAPYGQQGYGCEPKLYSPEPQGPDRPAERRKKTSGLATLRRRFIKRRKAGRSADHGRQMRELLSGWEVRDVAALVEEYEGTAALKELSLRADLARPEARGLRRDLAALYERRHCADVDLVFRGARFPAHRAILAARCPLFRKLLPPSPSPERDGPVPVDAALGGVDAPTFQALLRYLYTGELGGGGGDARARSADVLLRLSEEFGAPSPLEADMRGLCDRMCYYDSLLSFSAEAGPGEGEGAAAAAAAGGAGGGGGEELRAHKALLSARSPFFRNLLQRRTRSGEEAGDRAPPGPARIVLDESIIPKKYARVILHCMYTDAVDLSLVLRSSPSAGSLGEVQALVAGRGGMTRTEEAMELYHIALFLEFSMLAQGCEDIVAESISLDSIVAILRWSSQPYGSKWVHRQALHFLCEEFSQVMASDTLYELAQEHLLDAIQSDYLQASEQDVLKYVVKWGEHQLIRRMADREPNLLSGTAHSVNKRGVKRRDLDPEELKEILSPLLPCVRVDHILPAHSEVLSDALKRGLVSTPPSDMLPTAEGGRANAWLRLKSGGIYLRPRLFSPYVEEAKAALDELMVEQADLVRLRMVRMSNVPDTLYMVNNAAPQCCHMINHQQTPGGQTVTPPSVVANEIPVPRLAVVKQMTSRLQELRRAEPAQRAYALNCGEGASVSRALQLRVLRQFGLPDGAAELLQNPHKFFPEECFGDESPVLALRPLPGAATAGEGPPGFRPPLPPPPPPYHPPAAPGHAQLAAWRTRARAHPQPPPPPPSRSFSYPCSRAAPLPWRPAPKQGGPAHPPNCADLLGPAHPSYPGQQGLNQHAEPAVNELMPDVAAGVASLSLRGPQGGPDCEGHDPPPHISSAAPHHPPGFCHAGRHGAAPHKKHGADAEGRAGHPDLYAPPRHAPHPQARYVAGPDLYVHARPAPDPHPHRLRLPPRPDLAPPGDPQPPLARGRSQTEPDAARASGQARPPAVAVETQRPGAPEGPGGCVDDTTAGRDRRSPGKPEYPYRKSAL